MAKAKLDWLEECGYGPRVMKRTRVCSHCGIVANEGYSVCPGCGIRLMKKTLWDRYKERHMCCYKCGTVLASDSCYCPHCGSALYV